MKLVRFAGPARTEFLAAAVYYDRKQPGLGRLFAIAVENAARRVQRKPDLYRLIESNIRKCRVARFPYAPIFRERTDVIEIIAVMHLRRRPGYWRQRNI